MKTQIQKKKKDFWTLGPKRTPVYLRGLHPYDSYAVIFADSDPLFFHLYLN